MTEILDFPFLVRPLGYLVLLLQNLLYRQILEPFLPLVEHVLLLLLMVFLVGQIPNFASYGLVESVTKVVLNFLVGVHLAVHDGAARLLLHMLYLVLGHAEVPLLLLLLLNHEPVFALRAFTLT